MDGAARFRIGGRGWGAIARAPWERRHYHALLRGFRIYRSPLRTLWRYVSRRGRYPWTAEIRTRAGWRVLALQTSDDLLTVNEIFCREDYRVDPSVRQVVDLGGNIGVSALYFLTEAPQSRVLIYEPLEENTHRLREVLEGFEGRYELRTACVAETTGEVAFGVEPTGRYGGIGVQTGSIRKVPALGINEELERLVRGGGSIDLLKLDVEGMEWPLISALSPSIRRSIDVIYAEIDGRSLAIPGFHQRQRGWISAWVREGSDGERWAW